MSQPTSKPGKARQQQAQISSGTTTPETRRSIAERATPNDQAYQRNLPCLNPNCKSHGQPHPNCRCYGMAEGGVAGHYCASSKPHDPSCAYYMAEGGELQPMQPEATQAPQIAFNEDSPALAALAHGGTGMLYGSHKSPFFSAFGSGSSRLQSLIKPEDELKANVSNYIARVKKGSKHLDKSVESLFGGDNPDHEPATDKEIERVKEYIQLGQLDKEMQDQSQPQQFAEGGSVRQVKREDPLSSVFPDHNIALNTAKARSAAYLNSVRPQELENKLPFDAKRSSKAHDREYDKVIKLSARPLSILDKVKDGSLTPETLKHFMGMYPELHDHLNKKITEGIVKAQLEDKRPSYKTRQAMSLFLGTSLDSTLTPSNIQAAQSVFASKAQQQQQAQKPKAASKPNELSKASKDYATGDQAAANRAKQ